MNETKIERAENETLLCASATISFSKIVLENFSQILIAYIALRGMKF